MSQIRVLNVAQPTDPVMRVLSDTLVKTAQLAAEKATGQLVQPALYPRPDRHDALENIFYRRFAQLSNGGKKKLIQSTMPLLTLPEAERHQRYGTLASVSHALSVPVVDQVLASRPLQAAGITAAQVRNMEILPGLHLSDFSATPHTATYDFLQAHIEKVVCVDETNEGIWGEWGEDEIHLAGAATDHLGNTKVIDRFKVGDFDDGDVKEYRPAREFARFDLTADDFWPKVFSVSYILAEVDSGNFDELVAGIVQALVDEGKKVLEEYADDIATVVGATIGGAIGNAVGAIIGAALGWAIGKLFDLIDFGDMSDEVFDPQTAVLILPSATAVWEGPAPTQSEPATVRFKGHGGEYKLLYHWQLRDRTPAVQIQGRTSVKYTSGQGGARATFNALTSEFKDPVSYRWHVQPSHGMMGGATSQHLFLEGLTAGTYTISVTASSAGVSRQASVTLRVIQVHTGQPVHGPVNP